MGKLTTEKILTYEKIKGLVDIITENQYKELEKITKFYETSTIGNRMVNIRDFIIFGVDKQWLGRLRIIQNKLKSDTRSEYSTKIRYGDRWKEKYDEGQVSSRMTLQKFIELYGEEIGLEKWKLRNERVKSYGLDIMVKRYGEEIGAIKWKKTLEQKIQTMSERKKNKPYRNGRTLIEYQERFGVEKGYKLWDERNKRQSFRLSLDGFLSTHGEENGKLLWTKFCSNMNLTSKDSFIKRYGDEVGIEKYNEFIDKMRYTSTIEFYIEKYGEDLGVKKYREVLIKKQITFKNRYSKISQDLFWEIYKKIETRKCYFGELNGEFCFYVYDFGITIMEVDFKCGNKIIEFDGDYWHSKKEQKKKDKKRNTYLKSKNYEILRIKEGDYYKDKQKCIIKCIKFLNKK